MDFSAICNGFRQANKPVYIVRARMTPKKESELYDRVITVVYTASRKVVKTVIERLQAEGFTKDDYGVLKAPLAVPFDGVSKGA